MALSHHYFASNYLFKSNNGRRQQNGNDIFDNLLGICNAMPHIPSPNSSSTVHRNQLFLLLLLLFNRLVNKIQLTNHLFRFIIEESLRVHYFPTRTQAHTRAGAHK